MNNMEMKTAPHFLAVPYCGHPPTPTSDTSAGRDASLRSEANKMSLWMLGSTEGRDIHVFTSPALSRQVPAEAKAGSPPYRMPRGCGGDCGLRT